MPDTRRPTDFDQAVANALRSRRIAAGLTQEAIAQAAGVTYQQVQKYETGENRVSLRRCRAIAAALDCRMSDIIRDAEQALEADHGS
jgi:transcriptional regulator with XRE-family HTH domain